MDLSICSSDSGPLISLATFANRSDNVCYRKLYWTDQGTDSGVLAKIASANMDGSGIQTLFTGNLDHVEFLTIDIREQKLYWAVTSTGMVGDISLIIASLPVSASVVHMSDSTTSLSLINGIWKTKQNLDSCCY